MEGLGSVLPGLLQGGKIVYQLESNRVLDSYLGLRWDERILNVAEDFAHVIPGTIKYWLGQRSPIIEYKLIGEQYARTEVENSNFITFQFVRGDGNRNNYHANRWNNNPLLKHCVASWPKTWDSQSKVPILFYSCGWVTWLMAGSEVAGDLVLIQTPLLFLCK